MALARPVLLCLALLAAAVAVWLMLPSVTLQPDSGQTQHSRAPVDALGAAEGEIAEFDSDELGRLARLRDPNIDGLLALLNRQVAAEPMNEELLVLRGQIRWQLDQIDDALEDFSRATKVNPQNATAYLLRAGAAQSRLLYDSEQVMEDCQRAVEIDPNDHIAVCHRGNAHFGSGNYEKARADFELALKLKPGYVEAINNLGKIQENAGELDRALEYYNEALSLCPSYEAALGNRGHVHFVRGELLAALRDQIHVIILNPFNSTYQIDRGDTRAAMGDTRGAIADYSRAIDLDQHDAALMGVFKKRGELWQQLGEHHKAEQDLESHRRSGIEN